MVQLDWTPAGFASPGLRWNYVMEGIYFPLYSLDGLCWHPYRLRPNIAPDLHYKP